MAVQFYLNGKLCDKTEVAPTTTVLEYLREHAVLMGSKEGCGEGDCGACTIVVADTVSEWPNYLAVNACLLLLPQIDGKHIITVEGLANFNGGKLDPVQEALVKYDGSQCGFCTPGIIMSIFALRKSKEDISEEAIHETLAGNLCRCTGYRPIVEAARDACEDVPIGEKIVIPEKCDGYKFGDQSFFAPNSIGVMTDFLDRYPDATILGGGTDLGILVSKERQMFRSIVYTARVGELRHISEDTEHLTLGAAATFTEALPYLERLYPSLAHMVRRFGSRQVRNVGTVGGNIGNASPIGDMPPCLIALDATLILCSKIGEREVPVEKFFLDYRKTDLRKGEFIKAIKIPKLNADQVFRTYKISKRYDQDISAVLGAYRLEIVGGRIDGARIAYGGMAAIPKRATAAEEALTGNNWDKNTALAAATAITNDYAPISDHRASASYRSKIASNLFFRLLNDLSRVDEPLEVMAL